MYTKNKLGGNVGTETDDPIQKLVVDVSDAEHENSGFGYLYWPKLSSLLTASPLQSLHEHNSDWYDESTWKWLDNVQNGAVPSLHWYPRIFNSVIGRQVDANFVKIFQPVSIVSNKR